MGMVAAAMLPAMQAMVSVSPPREMARIIVIAEVDALKRSAAIKGIVANVAIHNWITDVSCSYDQMLFFLVFPKGVLDKEIVVSGFGIARGRFVDEKGNVAKDITCVVRNHKG